jgi:hypothetical protein
MELVGRVKKIHFELGTVIFCTDHGVTREISYRDILAVKEV